MGHINFRITGDTLPGPAACFELQRILAKTNERKRIEAILERGGTARRVLPGNILMEISRDNTPD